MFFIANSVSRIINVYFTQYNIFFVFSYLYNTIILYRY